MNPLATEATRSKSSLRHSHSFPNQTGHGGKESRARVKVGFLPIIGGVYKRWSWVTIIGDMKGRWPLDRREGRLGKAHEFDGVGCLHEKTTSSIRGDASVHRHRLSQGIQRL